MASQIKRHRWSAERIRADFWASPFRDALCELSSRGLDVTVWRDRKGVFATVGQLFRPGMEPEHANDGTEFASIILPAATDGEVAAFVSGVLWGEIFLRRSSESTRAQNVPKAI